MPLYSCFSRFGHLAYSSKLTHGERIYRQLRNTLVGEFPNPSIGQRSEAWMYATAMALARVRYTKERCANQFNPRKVVEMLPVRERQRGIVPGCRATVPDRQRVLSDRYVLPRGARETAVIEALVNAIGDDFLYYYVTKPGDILNFPTVPTTGPGNFIRTNEAAKIVRLTSNVVTLGVPVTVTYEQIAGEPISVGDVLVVSASNIGLAERVVPTAANSFQFTSSFTKSHDAGDVCTTGYFPYWQSTMSHVLVIVNPDVVLDAETRRKINVTMREIMRSITTWSIVPDDGTGTATAPFTVEDPVLGRISYAGIGSISYP